MKKAKQEIGELRRNVDQLNCKLHFVGGRWDELASKLPKKSDLMVAHSHRKKLRVTVTRGRKDARWGGNGAFAEITATVRSQARAQTHTHTLFYARTNQRAQRQVPTNTQCEKSAWKPHRSNRHRRTRSGEESVPCSNIQSKHTFRYFTN